MAKIQLYSPILRTNAKLISSRIILGSNNIIFTARVVSSRFNKSGYCFFFSSVVGRILEADECPLEVQSRWKAGEQGTFTLTLAEFEVIIVMLKGLEREAGHRRGI